MSEPVQNINDEESLLQHHRKQRKELQSKIQSLKKQVSKGDRKKKKEIDEEITKLESEFEEKCRIEIEKLKNDSLSKNDAEISSQQNIDNIFLSEKEHKISKTQRRRDKKEKDNIERERQIELQETEKEKQPAFIELNAINLKLKLRNLQIKEVRSDGNCMYYSVADQLSNVLSIHKTCQELREITSSYMLENRLEFEPYLELDNKIDSYEIYCNNIKDQTVWGGQLELKALADAFNVMIEVIQSEGSEIIIGNKLKTQESLIITYHRKMFGSGEHYNSTTDVNNSKENN